LRHARPARSLAALLIPLLPGCAFLAEAECRGQGERAGVFLGTRQTGETCSTTTTRSRDGRQTERTTRCTPTYRDMYQWNETSDRVFQACMASLAPPPAPVAMPPPAPGIK